MAEYRVREQYGVFFLEKKGWPFGWTTIYQDIGRYPKALQYPTLEQAFAAIETYQELKKASTPVYHYQIKGNTTPVEPHRED